MPSMSYCVCQNSRDELANCLDVLDDNDYQVYSEDEYKAIKQVIQMAEEEGRTKRPFYLPINESDYH